MMCLSFTIAAGPLQRNHSWDRVPRNSLPYFTVSDLKLPQPGESGFRIYIPQERDGPVMRPGTGFPFRRLLRFAGLRWRHSNRLYSVILLTLLVTYQNEPHRKHSFQCYSPKIPRLLFCVFFVAGTCIPSRCPETALVHLPISDV
jgi:hypothetical protein